LSILNPLYDAVAWVLMRIHAVLAVPFGASSGVTWGLSIVILVVLMRLLMVPLFIKQRNSMWKMQSHMPQLQELRKRYKSDKTRLNEETMKFYKENGINPLGGCLPLLAQMPVFFALFSVLRAIAGWQPGHTPLYGLTVPVVESAREAHIFGVTLYDSFLHANTGETWRDRIIILVFVLVSAATTFLTMKQSQRRGMLTQAPPDPDQPGAAAAQAMSKNMMYIAPFFALSGLYWQFGLVIYWVTTNIWTLGQQHFLFRKLPVVGSATVGESAVQAVSGSSAAAAKSGTSSTSAKAARSGTSSTSAKAARSGTPSASAKAARPASSAASKGASGAATAQAAGTKASANGSGTGGAANGSSMLRRFSRSKEEPQDVPVAPQAKVVRQQPVRQTRSKRGNSGKG
jgi:YidC/Oxa1 family membrane protein insertase